MSSWIDQVKERVDLVQVVGKYTTLKKAGREFKGLCPFHNEKTPSFYVVPAKGFYKCFGCGESGDAFTIVMKLEAVEFAEAAKRLAAEVGVEVQERPRRRTNEERSRLSRQAEIAASAPDGVWGALGLSLVAEPFGLGREVNEDGETLILPVYAGDDVPAGWLRYRVRRPSDGAAAAPEPLGLDRASTEQAAAVLFAPKDIRSQLIRHEDAIVTEDPLSVVRLAALGYGAAFAPVRPIGEAEDAPALDREQVAQLAKLGLRTATFLVAPGTDRERRGRVLRALHAAEPLLVEHGIEPRILTPGDAQPVTTWEWIESLGGVEQVRALLADHRRTVDLFQLRVEGVQRMLARRSLTREAAVEKLRPTLLAALVAHDRTLYHAYLAWAGRALGVRDRRELYRLVQVTRPAKPAEYDVF